MPCAHPSSSICADICKLKFIELLRPWPNSVATGDDQKLANPWLSCEASARMWDVWPNFPRAEESATIIHSLDSCKKITNTCSKLAETGESCIWDSEQDVLEFPMFTVTILMWAILGAGLKFFSSVPLFDSRHARYVEARYGTLPKGTIMNVLNNQQPTLT